MRLLFLFFLCICLPLHAIELDVKMLQEIVDNNPSVVKERILLAKYYEKEGNNLKALDLLNEVLEQDPKNDMASYLQEFIQKKMDARQILREASPSESENKHSISKQLQDYYEAKNYKAYLRLYNALIDDSQTIEDAYHVKAAYIYLWDEKYKNSKKALTRLEGEKNIDKARILAEICFYTGKYVCAINLYQQLYTSSYDLNYAIKLIQSNIYLGRIANAQELYNSLYKKYPSNKHLKGLGKKLLTLKSSYLLNRQKAYEENQNYLTLESYIIALYGEGNVEETFKVLADYNQHQSSEKSLLLEAKYRTWHNEYKIALDILHKDILQNNLEAKLLAGQIYSWEHNFDDAQLSLNEVIKYAENKQILYDARKAKAFCLMWGKENANSKKIFLQLSKENPADKDVKEALMELNNNYKGLILLYKTKVNNLQKPEDIKRLAGFYAASKNTKQAIKYLKTYVDTNPLDLEATKELAVLLIENKEYYQGFGYLEFYSAKKDDSKSAILLAKNYYWSGFSKEALDVLDRLLKKEPENLEALKLKAKILKISPRFTTSNSGATIGMYFDALGSKQLEIADSLYFNGHYKSALMYYENYLKGNPANHKVRYRYAFALENSAEYGKAEGEFALMLWTLDSDEVKYHYAYNMMKNKKYKEAKELFTKLQHNAYKKISPKMKIFLDNWKKDWESLDYKKYSAHYEQNFTKSTKWAYKKQAIFSSVNFISVGIYDPMYKNLVEDNNTSFRIRFYQEYTTNKKTDKGYKTLDVLCAPEETECRITKENWKKGVYKKGYILSPFIQENIKNIEIFQNPPLVQIREIQKKKKQKGIVPIVERAEEKIQKPTKHKDIVLAAGLNKDLETNNYVFNSIVARSRTQDVLLKSLINPSVSTKQRNTLLASWYLFEDSDKIKFQSIDLFYEAYKITENFALGVDGGLFSIEQAGKNKYNGKRFGISAFYDKFKVRLGINKYDDFSEIVPSIEYKNKYKKHEYTLGYIRQNALFYTYSLVPYEKRIVSDHFTLSDYAEFEDKTSLWASAEVDNYSNGDLAATVQFDWNFYYDTVWTPNFTYTLALEGYYTAHSKQHNDFYSPSFDDATLLRFNPQYIFSKSVGIKGSIGAGHSVTGESIPYKYGGWVFGTPIENMSYMAGCLYNSTVRTSLVQGTYNFTECKADLGYSW